MRFKAFWFLSVFLLLSPIVLAQVISQPSEILIDIKPIRDAISAGDVAVFNVTITNEMSYDDSFRIRFSNDVEWTILTEPLKYKFSRFDLAVGESANFLVKIRASPAAGLGYNQYIIGMVVSAEVTKKEATSHLTIGYGPQFLTPKQYAALIVARVDVPEMVDPRGAMLIKLNLKNKNPLNISGLDIFLKSLVVDQKMTIDLMPLEEKTLYITQELNPLESPKQDVLVVEIVRQNATLVRLEKSFEVISYSKFDTTTKERKALLENIYLIQVINNGNYKTTNNVKHQTTFLKSVFTQTEPMARLVKEDGKRYIEWTLELGPNEKTQLSVVENYWPIVYIGALVFAVFILYYLLRSPIVVRKDSIIVATSEGGIAGLKIVLTIKNRTNRIIRDLKIVDSVPNIAVVDKELDLEGLIPPKVVKHEKRGTLLKWDIGDMGARDERILSYKLKSRLAILGNFTLPAAITKFGAKGRERIVYSNRLRMST